MKFASVALILALAVTVIAAPLEANHDSKTVNLSSDGSNKNAAEEPTAMAKRQATSVLSLVPTLLKGIKFNEPAHS